VRRAAARLGLLAALAVSAAYLVQLPQSLPLAGPLGSALLDGFHPSEGASRWSSGHGVVRFPDPGPGVRYRVELDVSAWRPRGHDAGRATVAAGGEAREARLAARPETVSLAASAPGWWRGDLVVVLDSDTFRPGPSDTRLLGARLHGARLMPLAGVIGMRRPPLGQVVAAVLATAALFFGLVKLGAGRRAAERAAGSAALLLALAFVFARPWAAVLAWPLAMAASALAVLASSAPGAARGAAGLLGQSGRAMAVGLRALRAWPALAVAAGAGLAVTAAYRAHPALTIDLGSGHEAAVARRFGASDGAEGVTFRQPLRGAELDLRDFGGGGPWMIALTASTAGEPRTFVLARAGTEELTASLDSRWATPVFRAPAPWGWRSGLAVTFPSGAESAGLRLDRVSVDRQGRWPSLRVTAAVVAASLLIVMAAAAAGLRGVVPYAAAGLAALGQALALANEPLAAIPFAASFTGICLVGALFAAILAGAQRLRAARQRAGADAPASLPAAALFAAAAGFVAWLAAASFPLYRGGHFVFHSSIAEEIWRGRFLLFYLPYPGSILSRQEQWGSIIVPHPCLYHTVVAPLAALPRPWFHAVEKALLALALATLVLLSARLAQRLDGERAAAFAAVVFATLVPTFQVLGLGHLMMLFGVWAASLALVFVLLRFEALARPATCAAAMLLLALCFLSYTASLLFGSMVLAASVALLRRHAPAPARALALALAGAWLLAFGLYYVNWAWPFLSESLPRIVSWSSPGGDSGSLWTRLALQPRKLSYTYGSVAVPVLGLGGLVLARRAAAPARVILLCWAAILVAIGGLDLFFNFLRKHHYFVMVPVAVGGGVLLARLAETGRAGRVVAGALCLAAAALGLQTAIDVALGRIP
jgi:hypothetical protein